MSNAAASFNSASATWEEHRSVFFKALQESDRAILETVIEKYPEAVNWRDEKGTPPLHAAFDKRDLDTFKYLLEKGADPSQQENLSGLRAFFSPYDDYYIIEKAIKAGEKDYIVPLLQQQDNLMRRNVRPPKEVRFEILDLLERARSIRTEYREQKRTIALMQKMAAEQTAAPVAAPATEDSATIEVLKPAQVQRRVPGTPVSNNG